MLSHQTHLTSLPVFLQNNRLLYIFLKELKSVTSPPPPPKQYLNSLITSRCWVVQSSSIGEEPRYYTSLDWYRVVWKGKQRSQICHAHVYVPLRGSPHTSQISHLLPYPSLWLLVPGLNSQLLPLFPIQLAFISAVVGNIFQKWLQDFVTFGNPCQ